MSKRNCLEYDYKLLATRNTFTRIQKWIKKYQLIGPIKICLSIRHGKRLFPDKLPITFSDNRFQQANQGIFKTNPLPLSNKIEHPNLGIVMVYNVIIFHFSCCHFFPQFLQQHTQCSKVRSQIFLTLELFCAKFPQPFVPCVCAFELEKVIVVQRNVN